jgi:hypothetical protein
MKMLLRYRVFGYTDVDSMEVLLATYMYAEDAIRAAEASNMASCVIDWETDELLWEVFCGRTKALV